MRCWRRRRQLCHSTNLDRLRREDNRSAAWLAALPAALVEETNSAGRSAASASRRTARGTAHGVAGARARQCEICCGGHRLCRYRDWDEMSVDVWPTTPVAGVPAAAVEEDRQGWLRISWLKAVAVLVPIVLLALAFLWWQQQQRLDNMVFVPAGTYPVSSEASGGAQQAALAAFAIDRTEVTIADFRRCIAAGRCPQPTSTAGVTRPNYLLDPAFSRYPVVNVDWRTAGEYCAWAGKRLPSAVEWEVAAGYAPSTGRQYIYPWGDQFQVQRANSQATGIGDTQVVGSYQPAGDSPWGASDMAGNAAEWTASNIGKDPEAADANAPDRFLVKGGSFQDAADKLAVTSAAQDSGHDQCTMVGISLCR